eukprot:TRINITY_DN5354_c0_g1_i2.p1 TRINITY_DN5354_c0_g1~~TRINITY_DN5354_c0_g1_i2.p1  ORF type:complete len:356 (-),score=51.85 TRINITY_DN5354_c0_g1_i2:629-1642(-)
MDQPLNYTLLDDMILDYLTQEGILSPKHSKNSLQQSQREKLEQLSKIRTLIMDGKMEEAIESMKELNQKFLKDPLLQFNFQKQQFIEFLRTDPKSGYEKALDFCNKTFAPFSLNAFPEAYSQFCCLTMLLLFMPDPKIAPHPLPNEWSEKQREELAGNVHLALLRGSGIQEPKFTLLLRQLITSHGYHHMYQNTQSPYPEIETLIGPDRSPPFKLEKKVSGTDIKFNDRDVQTLIQVVSISQQEAYDSLAFTNGNLNNAIINELSRIKMNHSALSILSLEYCYYRGLLTDKDFLETKGVTINKTFINEHYSTNTFRRKLRDLSDQGNLVEILNFYIH